MRTLRFARFAVAGSAVLLFAGCGSDDPPPPDGVDELTPAPTIGAPAGETGRMEATDSDAVTADITPLDGSGFGGTVRLAATNGGTHVEVTLRGVSAGVHQGHIHGGTCSERTGAITPLEPVTTTESGSGQSMSMLTTPLSQLRSSPHIIVYHEAGGAPGASVACAEIPAVTM